MWTIIEDEDCHPIEGPLRKAYGLELGEQVLPERLALLLDALHAQDSARRAPEGETENRQRRQ